MLDLDAPIDVGQPNMRATLANLSTQVMSDKSMMIDVQSKIVTDATGDRASLHLSIRIGRNG